MSYVKWAIGTLVMVGVSILVIRKVGFLNNLVFGL